MLLLLGAAAFGFTSRAVEYLAVTRVLSTGSGVLLADEPTGNLDETNSAQVMELLLDLAHTAGRCVIVATHDPDLASRADQTPRMRNGSLS